MQLNHEPAPTDLLEAGARAMANLNRPQVKNMVQAKVIGSHTVTAVALPDGQVALIPTEGQLPPGSIIEFSCDNVHPDGKVVGFGKLYDVQAPELDMSLKMDKAVVGAVFRQGL